MNNEPTDWTIYYIKNTEDKIVKIGITTKYPTRPRVQLNEEWVEYGIMEEHPHSLRKDVWIRERELQEEYGVLDGIMKRTRENPESLFGGRRKSYDDHWTKEEQEIIKNKFIETMKNKTLRIGPVVGVHRDDPSDVLVIRTYGELNENKLDLKTIKYCIEGIKYKSHRNRTWSPLES